MKFIRDNAGTRPFFAYLPYTPPHGNFDIPDGDSAWTIYKDKPWPESARRYAAMVTMLDRQVGEVLELLDELGLAHNTLVFFCGDNGGNDYFKSAEHPRGIHLANKNPRTGVEYRGTKGTYDLSRDPSESKDLAEAQPEILTRLTNLAAQAHEPVIEGTFASTDSHERDRRAKFGRHDEPEAPTQPRKKTNKKKAAK